MVEFYFEARPVSNYCEEGKEYVFRITEATDHISEKDGAEYVRVTYVVDQGPCEGRTVWDTFWMSNTWHRNRMGSLATAAGVSIDMGEGKGIKANTEDLKGKSVIGVYAFLKDKNGNYILNRNDYKIPAPIKFRSVKPVAPKPTLKPPEPKGPPPAEDDDIPF